MVLVHPWTLLPEIYVLGTMFSFQLVCKAIPRAEYLRTEKNVSFPISLFTIYCLRKTNGEGHFLRCHRISGKKWGEPSQERTSWCSCLQETAFFVLLPSEEMLLGDWIPGGEKSKWPKSAQGLGAVVGEGGKITRRPETPSPLPAPTQRPRPLPTHTPGSCQCAARCVANDQDAWSFLREKEATSLEEACQPQGSLRMRGAFMECLRRRAGMATLGEGTCLCEMLSATTPRNLSVRHPLISSCDRCNPEVGLASQGAPV